MSLELRHSDRLFRELPLLDCLASQIPHPPLAQIVLVCVQHLLETTGSLIQKLLSLGLNPGSTYILGKAYSSNSTVEDRLRRLGVNVVDTGQQQFWGEYSTQLKEDVSRLWQHVAQEMPVQRSRGLIVLDDGGFCLKGMPPRFRNLPVVGVEQTMSGLSLLDAPPPFPVIDVASSAAKQCIEPPMIAETVLAKLASYPLPDGPTGVVGFGNIGRAMTHSLQRIRSPILVFDESVGPAPDNGQIDFCDSLEELYSSSATVFGCTGKDTLAGKDWWRNLSGERLLISCSSQDLEFRSVLTSLNNVSRESISQRRLTSEATVPLARGQMRVLRGGFPVNFDGSIESVPAADIQMTRGLLLGAILQAASLVENDQAKPLRTMLLPELQRLVVSEWISIRPSRKGCFEPWLLNKFLQGDSEWIEFNSGGVLQEHAYDPWAIWVP